MKAMAAGAIFHDEEGKILVVKPTYREEWLIPGGVIENDESPYAGCAREVKEELGITLTVRRLLCMEYHPSLPPWREMIQFLFYGGVLSPEQIGQIVLDQTELSDFCFLSEREAIRMLAPRLDRQVENALIALQDGRIVYLEDGNQA